MLFKPEPASLVHYFQQGIKHDITQFTLLKNDAMWDNWNRSTVAQARTQDISDVLDFNYIPPNQEARELFIQ